MKTKVFVIVILFNISVFSQHPLPQEFLTLSVLIKCSNGSSASGFYFMDSTKFYLVTAKHVFFEGPNNRLVSNSADLISYPRNPYQESYNLLRCDLKYLLDNNLVRYHPTFDVAVALIGNMAKLDSINYFVEYNNSISKPNPKNSRVNQFSKEIILKSKDVPVGAEVHLFGYPSSIGIREMPQLEPNQPLLRRGIVAGKNYKQNTIILDCPAYQGNSGGPVVASIYDGTTTKFYLIGVVSQFVPFEQRWINDKYGYENIEYSNSGYSIIAPIDIMLDLIQQIK